LGQAENAKVGREGAHCASEAHVSHAVPIAPGCQSELDSKGAEPAPGIRNSPDLAASLLANLGFVGALKTYHPADAESTFATHLAASDHQRRFSMRYS
jgi:hypothetical protein